MRKKGNLDTRIKECGDLLLASEGTFTNVKEYIKDKYKLLVGDRTAQNIKHEIGCVYKDKDKDKKKSMKVKGRDLISGLPKTVVVTQDEVMEALKDDISKIIEATKYVLENTPPELAADLMENGIVLTGGGSLINGMEKLFSEKLEVPVRLANNPLTSVVEGTGIMLDNIKILAK